MLCTMANMSWKPDVAEGDTSLCMVAPFEVSPGHMMLAPDSTNLMAPVSTRSFGIMSGY